MVKFLIHKPVAVVMTFIALLILGIVSYQQIPVSLLPDIDIPEITIQINYSGYSARETEDLISAPLRRQLMQCNHLEDIKSETSDGTATLRLRFSYRTNIDYAYIEVNEKTDQAMGRLPRDLERPRVIKASASDIPVFYLNITLNDSISENNQHSDFIEMSRFIENVVSRRIEQLSEVALVDITGTDDPEIEIVPNAALMQSLGINYRHIENALSAYNYRLGNVSIREGYYQYSIRFTNQLNNVDDIRNIYLNTGERILQLKDIAHVNIKARKQEGIFTSDNKRGISLAIIKQSDAKMNNLRSVLTQQINRLRRDYPQLKFKITQDQTALLEYSMGNLKQSLFLGALLAIAVVFLFISNWRLPIIIGVIIPVSLILSFILLMLFDISINIISLSGLVLGVGMMIDNSIIVIDNITQHRERGLNAENASIKGTNEIIVPLLSSMLTNCAVYIPLIFISGITGALFYDQAVAVSVGLGVSFIVAITLIPVIYFAFFKKDETLQKKVTISFINFRNGLPLEKFYENGVKHVFRYPKTYLFSFIALIGFSIVFFKYIDKERFPKIPLKELIIKIDWNEPITLEANRNRIDSLLKNQNKYITHYNSWIGQQKYLMDKDKGLSQSEAMIYIEAKTNTALDSLKKELSVLINRSHPTAEFIFSAPENIFEKTFSDNESPFVVQLKGKYTQPAYNEIFPVIVALDSILELKTGNKLKTNSYFILHFNPEKLLLYKIPLAQLVSKLKTLLNDYQIGTLKTTGEIIPLKITGNESSLMEVLQSETVENSEGASIPLRELITVTEGNTFKTIYAGIDGEYIPVSYDFKNKNLNNSEEKVKNLLHTKFVNFDVSFSGSIYNLLKILKELWVVLLISFVLLYLILAAQFESLMQPLIVLLEIPIDIAGMLLLLYAFGESVNIMSVTGIIVMSGIVINDSILKLDTINRLRREEKLDLIEAIKEGGKRRLRPILMTSLTAMLALTPGLFASGLGAELQKPFSITIVGGLFLGTLVSLFFIPVAYWFIYRK